MQGAGTEDEERAHRLREELHGMNWVTFWQFVSADGTPARRHRSTISSK